MKPIVEMTVDYNVIDTVPLWLHHIQWVWIGVPFCFCSLLWTYTNSGRKNSEIPKSSPKYYKEILYEYTRKPAISWTFTSRINDFLLDARLYFQYLLFFFWKNNRSVFFFIYLHWGADSQMRFCQMQKSTAFQFLNQRNMGILMLISKPNKPKNRELN